MNINLIKTDSYMPCKAVAHMSQVGIMTPARIGRDYWHLLFDKILEPPKGASQ